MHDRRGLKPARSSAVRMERIVASSGRLPKAPRARETKTSRCRLAERTRTTAVVAVVENGGSGGDGGERWWWGNQREDRDGGERSSLTKAAVVRGGGSRHFCPSAEKTRECNHVVQCVTRELEILTRVFRGQWQVSATGLQGSAIRSRGHENSRQPGVHVPETVSESRFIIIRLDREKTLKRIRVSSQRCGLLCEWHKQTCDA